MKEAGTTALGKKFVPAFFVDIVDHGHMFGAGLWPAHITMFPPVEEPYRLEYGEQMRKWANPIKAFEVTVGEDDWFGASGEVPVKRINDERLQRVHGGLVAACARMLHDETYRQPYNAHISYPDESGIKTGQRIHIGGFAIVARQIEGWQVVDKIGFRG